MRYLALLCLCILSTQIDTEDVKSSYKKHTLPKKFFSEQDKSSVKPDSTTPVSIKQVQKDDVLKATAATLSLDKAVVPEIPFGNANKSDNIVIPRNEKFNRTKKSATTTFCVEIRPNSPYQKPFQVCEPDDRYSPGPVYALPIPQGPYSGGSSYGSQSIYAAAPAYSKPGYSSTAASLNSGAVSFSGGKTGYSAPSAPYSSAKSANPADFDNLGIANDIQGGSAPNIPPTGVLQISQFPIKTSEPVPAHDSGISPSTAAAFRPEGQSLTIRSDEDSEEEGDTIPEENSNKHDQQNARTFGEHEAEYDYGYDYGGSYGTGGYGGYPSQVTYVTHVKPKKYKKYKKEKKDKEYAHSGLVITCQPSLAGYTSGAPHYNSYGGGYGYGEGYGSGYGRSYSGAYEPVDTYKPAPTSYNPPPSYGVKPVYGYSYNLPSYSVPPKPSYGPPESTYYQQHGKPYSVQHDHQHEISPYHPPTASYGSTSIANGEGPYSYNSLQSYGPQPYKKPSYASAPSKYNAPAYSSQTYSAPAYLAPAYPLPTYSAPTYSPPAYSAPSYPSPVYSPGYHHAPAHYAGPYRSADDEPRQMSVANNPSINTELSHESKQMHTIQHMQDISNNRLHNNKVSTENANNDHHWHGKKLLQNDHNTVPGTISRGKQPENNPTMQSQSGRSMNSQPTQNPNGHNTQDPKFILRSGWVNAQPDVQNSNSPGLSPNPEMRAAMQNLGSGSEWRQDMSARIPSNNPMNDPHLNRNEGRVEHGASGFLQTPQTMNWNQNSRAVENIANPALVPSGEWSARTGENQNQQLSHTSNITPEMQNIINLNTESNMRWTGRESEMQNSMQNPSIAPSGGWPGRNAENQNQQMPQKEGFAPRTGWARSAEIKQEQSQKNLIPGAAQNQIGASSIKAEVPRPNAEDNSLMPSTHANALFNPDKSATVSNSGHKNEEMLHSNTEEASNQPSMTVNNSGRGNKNGSSSQNTKTTQDIGWSSPGESKPSNGPGNPEQSSLHTSR